MSIGKNFAGVIAFMKVAASESFSEAARDLGISVPSVSRSITRLETQLAIKLLERTTHSVAVTQEGRRFFQECLPSVEHLLRTTEALKHATQSPCGVVRVSSTVGFGRKCIAPLLPGFCKSHPDITLEFDLNDRHVDFAEGRVDVAIRNGRLEDADVIARQLAPMSFVTCAAPEYLHSAGYPQTLEDLAAHKTIAFRLAQSGKPHVWEFEVDGQFIRLPLPYSQLFNDPELVALAAVAGGGVAQLAGYQAQHWIAQQRLIVLLPGYAAQAGAGGITSAIGSATRYRCESSCSSTTWCKPSRHDHWVKGFCLGA